MLLDSVLEKLHDDILALESINEVKFTFKEMDQIPKQDYPLAIIHDGSSQVNVLQKNAILEPLYSEVQTVSIYTIFRAKESDTDADIMLKRNNIDKDIVSVLANYQIENNITIDRDFQYNSALGFMLNLAYPYYGSQINVNIKRKEK